MRPAGGLLPLQHSELKSRASGQAAHPRRGAKDRGEHRQATGGAKMAAYLILFIAFLPVALIMRFGMRSAFGLLERDLTVANIAGMLAIYVILLSFFAFIAIAVLDLLGVLDGHQARRIAVNIAELPGC
jgi:hypothetical protein